MINTHPHPIYPFEHYSHFDFFFSFFSATTVSELQYFRSPRHQQQGKAIALGKDLVELQSFLNNSTNNNNSNGYVTQKRIGHSGNGGNYALPYDVLPVVTQSKQQHQSGNNNNMAIYGQRTTFISANNNNNNEPLYATAKLININGGGGQFVNYGPKVKILI